MDTRTLQLFLTLADTLHFTQASERSHVSPSTLSRAIKQLEAEAGAKLFERDNRSVTLTHQGTLFKDYAIEALQQWDSIKNQLLAEATELHGEISMYCSVTASYSFLYKILSEFRRNHPKIEIKIHTGDPDHAIARILSGDDDIAIAAQPEQLPKTLAFKAITVSPLVFIAPTLSNILINRQTGIDWQRVPMILPEGGIARERINHWFDKRAIKPRIYAQISGNEAIVSMVSLGFGVGVVPKIVLDNSPLANKVQIIDVQPSLKPYYVGLFTPEKKLQSPIIQAFWSQIH